MNETASDANQHDGSIPSKSTTMKEKLKYILTDWFFDKWTCSNQVTSITPKMSVPVLNDFARLMLRLQARLKNVPIQ